MQIILSCKKIEYSTMLEKVEEMSADTLEDNQKWFYSFKELQVDGSGRY